MYKNFSPIAYTDADIFLIVFSVADPQSFENAKTKVDHASFSGSVRFPLRALTR